MVYGTNAPFKVFSNARAPVKPTSASILFNKFYGNKFTVTLSDKISDFHGVAFNHWVNLQIVGHNALVLTRYSLKSVIGTYAVAYRPAGI